MPVATRPQRSSEGIRLLDDGRYLRFLSQTHPELDISISRFEVPSFVAPLDVREPLLPGVFRALLNVGLRLTPSHVMPATLFLGTPFERYDQTELLSQLHDPVVLAETSRRYAERMGLELVVFTCVRADHPAIAPLLRAGFYALPSFPDTVVPLVGQDFDTHLLSLPPGDRSGIRRNIRRFERGGHRLERVYDSKDRGTELFAAYQPMYERATVKWIPHTEGYFAGIAALDERVHLTVAKNEAGDLLGFVINFADGDAFHAGRIGVRPDYYRRDAVYFRLLYHVLSESLHHGASRLVLEPTGYRMKRHLGARRKPLVNLVQGVSPTWRLLLSSSRGIGKMALSHLENRKILERHY